jgi:hypothetical protein
MAKKLRVLFEPPGWFLVDCELTVSVDGNEVFRGGFRGGFDAKVEVDRGEHVLRTVIRLGEIGRLREYRFRLDDEPEYVAELHYSRIWGNFTKDLCLGPAAAVQSLVGWRRT